MLYDRYHVQLHILATLDSGLLSSDYMLGKEFEKEQ